MQRFIVVALADSYFRPHRHESRSELALRLSCIENWLTEHIRCGALAGTKDPELRASAHSATHESVFNTRALFQALDGVRELRAALGTGINRSLVLESLLRSLRT